MRKYLAPSGAFLLKEKQCPTQLISKKSKRRAWKPAQSQKSWQTPFALIVTPLTIKLPYTPLNVAQLEVDGILWSFVFYDNGLAVNVLYTLEEGGKRAVGFKLSDGIDIPKEFEGKFKFARQRSKLAGEIRGTFFVVKGEYL
ncbi:hypothetical protein [Streptococcus suis]|uniref:hypothetical protein n=1 Tax=Streptococcus suis TaxID=1307 RepID=UPI003AF25B8D